MKTRRTFLTSVVAGGIPFLAGCAQRGNDTPSSSTDTRSRSSTRTATPSPTPESSSFSLGAGPTVRIEPVAENLQGPLGLEVAEEETDRRFIIDKVGRIHVHDSSGSTDQVFLDISHELSTYTGEQGLLGMAFHPDFRNNRRFYVRYSAPRQPTTPDSFDHTEMLSEFEATADLREADPTSERVLMEIPSPQKNHNSGALAFGPDGYLYVGMGDGGGEGDSLPGHVDDWYATNSGGNGQDVRRNLLGSVLRIDVDGRSESKPYGIPDDNPLVGTEGLDEHYAWGFRNPWGMSFDSRGRLFVADVGQSQYEEINLVEKGGNYGWNVKEGSKCFNEDEPNTPLEGGCPATTSADVRGGEPIVDPILEYPHTANGETIGLAVIGGYFYEQDTIPELQNTYVFGDWYHSLPQSSGSLFMASPPSDGDSSWSMSEVDLQHPGGALGRFVLSLGRDRDGELYLLTRTQEEASGVVYKIVPPN